MLAVYVIKLVNLNRTTVPSMSTLTVRLSTNLVHHVYVVLFIVDAVPTITK